MTSDIAKNGIEVKEVAPENAWVVKPDALQFVADLHRAFEARRRNVLKARQERQMRLVHGERPDFLPHTKEIRESEWQVATLPDELLDRRVEITGPVDR